MTKEADETDARAYVETSATHLLGELRDLEAIVGAVYEGTDVVEELGVGRVGDALGQDVGDMTPGELSTAAEDRLLGLPLAAERTMTWELVLATGGPDRRLCFECAVEMIHPPDGRVVPTYEIARVHYRCSWSGSAEVRLYGTDREVAESFARRVVSELA